MKDNEYEFPENATIRKEHVKCGNPDCQHLRGQKSRYDTNKNEKIEIHNRDRAMGNLMAREYLEKPKNGKVSTDLAYKVLVNSICEENAEDDCSCRAKTSKSQ
jgi:hypothetical protein